MRNDGRGFFRSREAERALQQRGAVNFPQRSSNMGFLPIAVQSSEMPHGSTG
jgi:hypothetical protein